MSYSDTGNPFGIPVPFIYEGGVGGRIWPMVYAVRVCENGKWDKGVHSVQLVSCSSWENCPVALPWVACHSVVSWIQISSPVRGTRCMLEPLLLTSGTNFILLSFVRWQNVMHCCLLLHDMSLSSFSTLVKVTYNAYREVFLKQMVLLSCLSVWDS